MAFRSQDLCKTTRRIKGSSQRQLFPRLLRDDRLLPRLGVAIRFFETHLGMRRCDLDADALVHLFDEPKLARCLVSCLARSYRYRTRSLAEVVGSDRAAALAARGLVTPADLRALAYHHANAGAGFVAPTERAAFLTSLAPEFDLAEVEQALWLDAPDQTVLMRVGPVPTPADIRALYNLRVLETLLRSAATVRLALCGKREQVAAVCHRHRVRLDSDGVVVTLHGEQDALGLWTRHGSRVAQATLVLLAGGLVGPGEATVWLGDEAYEVRLDRTVLRYTIPSAAWAASGPTWEAFDDLLGGLAEARRTGRLAGWRLRRWPDPLVSEAGTIWPEAAISRGTQMVGLLPMTAADLRASAAALTALAERLPFVVLVPEPVPQMPAGLTVLPLTGSVAPLWLADYLERASRNTAAEPAAAWLADLAAAARAAGSLAESELARRLDCAEEHVGGRLAPLADSAADLVYIDGFGLCAARLLARVEHLLDHETQRNGGRLDLGILGRKLRVLIGRNEGLHALIAHVSGELRPVA